MRKKPGKRQVYLNPRRGRRSPEAGGVAVEYTLVSTFAIFLAIVLLKFSATFFKEKIDSAAKKVGMDTSGLNLNIFEEEEEETQ